MSRMASSERQESKERQSTKEGKTPGMGGCGKEERAARRPQPAAISLPPSFAGREIDKYYRQGIKTYAVIHSQQTPRLPCPGTKTRQRRTVIIAIIEYPRQPLRVYSADHTPSHFLRRHNVRCENETLLLRLHSPRDSDGTAHASESSVLRGGEVCDIRTSRSPRLILLEIPHQLWKLRFVIAILMTPCSS
ncbi:hypothetical protein BC629DRAFT_915776 [Irpex lacteus]|nr:hypothetical protein BC629DRAFT_915776 [Irpex lacteus]